MTYAWQYFRSLVFVIQMYLSMVVLGIVFFPAALVGRKGAFVACHTFARWVRWTASWMIGLKTEARGTPPTDAVLIAAKHQSFLDILLIYSCLERSRFIIKRELIFTPIMGQYILRLGCIPVNRGKRAEAIKKMQEDVAKGMTEPGQLVIYPQGTRIAPGVKAPYKVGAAVLYEQLGQDCVPVACNVGVFWPKTGIMKKPGTAIIEFLPRLPAGLSKEEFLSRLETEVETRSDALMREAGFDPDS